MKKWTGKYIVSFLVCMLFFMNTGFVVNATANPVSAFWEKESDKFYKVILYLQEDADMQAYQLRVEFDSNKLSVTDEDAYSYIDSFTNRYNKNNSALMTKNVTEKGKKSAAVFVGVQTDETCAYVTKGIQIAMIRFQIKDVNADVAEIAEALNSLTLLV